MCVLPVCDIIPGMTQDEKIQSILDRIQELFAHSVGPRNRREYMQLHGFHGIDWSFGLTADDIINRKIPPAVCGCSGIASVFIKYAGECGLDCVALPTAMQKDLDGAAQDRKNGERERTINGHQIVAVRDAKGVLRAFDPGHPRLRYLDTQVTVGATINFHFGACRIAAILSPSEYAKIDTYKKLRDVYVNAGEKKHVFTNGIKRLTVLERIKNLFQKEND